MGIFYHCGNPASYSLRAHEPRTWQSGSPPTDEPAGMAQDDSFGIGNSIAEAASERGSWQPKDTRLTVIPGHRAAMNPES
jgi:hypothetical protein